jgi:hypothetical protein
MVYSNATTAANKKPSLVTAKTTSQKSKKSKTNDVIKRANQWEDVVYYECGVSSIDQPEEEYMYRT